MLRFFSFVFISFVIVNLVVTILSSMHFVGDCLAGVKFRDSYRASREDPFALSRIRFKGERMEFEDNASYGNRV